MNKILLLLDWDDTCLPSTHFESLSTNKLSDFTESDNIYRYLCTWKTFLQFFDNEIQTLESHILYLLDFCSLNGVNCLIVSCAEKSWVEESCKIVFPRLWQFLYERRIPIMSARCTEYPHTSWKEQKFRNIISTYDTYSLKSAISIGDSNYDRLGLRAACKESSVISKTILMLQNPNLTDLSMQWEVLLRSLNYIISETYPLDVKLARIVETNINKDVDLKENVSEDIHGKVP